MGLWSVVMGVAIAGTNVVQPGDDLAGYTNGLLPGDVIQFSDGEYALETGLDWTSPGTADQPIIFEAAPGATPVLRAADGDYVADLIETEWVEVRGLTFAGPPGASEESWLGGLRTYWSSHVLVEDCSFESLPGLAVRIEGDATDITVTGSAFRDLPWRTAIEVGCWDASCWLQDGRIEGNWIHGLAGEYGTAIYLHHGTQGVSVRNNVITDVAYRGLYAGSTEYGEPNLIEGNAIWDVGEHGMWLEGAARVRNNIIAATGGVGIHTYRADRGGLDDLVIAWNTLSDTGSWAIYLEHWPQATGMVLASNAVGNPLGYGLWYTPPDEGATTDNRLVANVITGAVEGIDPEIFPDALIAGTGTADFEDWEGMDLYPARESTLIDAGDTSAAAFVPEVDFNGVPRDGNAPDAGAYEYIGEGNPGWVITDGFKELGYVEHETTVDVPLGCCSGSDKDGGKSAWLLAPLGLLLLRRRRCSITATRGAR